MSVCAKFQLPSLSRSDLKVPDGVVGCSVMSWLMPILVFTLSLNQAEQYSTVLIPAGSPMKDCQRVLFRPLIL